jgi:hypothetical protein
MNTKAKDEEPARCRWCRAVLHGRAYQFGGPAFLKLGGKEAPVNYYGGYVCSRSCDYRACLELEGSMPGHGGQTRPGTEAMRSIEANWPEQ